VEPGPHSELRKSGSECLKNKAKTTHEMLYYFVQFPIKHVGIQQEDRIKQETHQFDLTFVHFKILSIPVPALKNRKSQGFSYSKRGILMDSASYSSKRPHHNDAALQH
jgi:hypothetical protein